MVSLLKTITKLNKQTEHTQKLDFFPACVARAYINNVEDQTMEAERGTF